MIGLKFQKLGDNELFCVARWVDPRVHLFAPRSWIAGSSPAMTPVL
jgi:hypothetical protein